MTKRWPGILARLLREAQKDWAELEAAWTEDEYEYEALQQRAIQERLGFVEAPAARQRARRLAVLQGFSLHADTAVHGHDRQGRERLCRYGARGPVPSPDSVASTTAGTGTRRRRARPSPSPPQRWCVGSSRSSLRQASPHLVPRRLRPQRQAAPAHHVARVQTNLHGREIATIASHRLHAR